MGRQQDNGPATGSHRPLAFGIYDEGNGVRSLYLSGVPSRYVARSVLPFAADGVLAVLSPLPPPEGCQPLPAGGWMGPGERVLGIREPVEVLVLDGPVEPRAIDRSLPGSLLARPDLAVPEGLGARFALVLEPPDQAVVLARRDGPLAAVVAAGLTLAARRALGPAAPLVAPGQVGDLLHPVEAGAWRRVTPRAGPRFATLRIETLDSEADGARLDDLVWVARAGVDRWNDAPGHASA